MEVVVSECWRLVCIVMDCHINVSVIIGGVVWLCLLNLLKVTEVSDYTPIVTVAVYHSQRKKFVVACDVVV